MFEKLWVALIFGDVKERGKNTVKTGVGGDNICILTWSGPREWSSGRAYSRIVGDPACSKS
jgi:hypothetical protein